MTEEVDCIEEDPEEVLADYVRFEFRRRWSDVVYKWFVFDADGRRVEPWRVKDEGEWGVEEYRLLTDREYYFLSYRETRKGIRVVLYRVKPKFVESVWLDSDSVGYDVEWKPVWKFVVVDERRDVYNWDRVEELGIPQSLKEFILSCDFKFF